MYDSDRQRQGNNAALVDGEDDATPSRPRERPSKRRKTMGDAPSAPGSSLHTQTLTQLLSDGSLILGDQDTKDRRDSVVPQTPSGRGILKSEVPSSQPTPFTPMLDRYGPLEVRSPLKHRSTNVDAPTPTTARWSGKRPRSMVIQDSLSSAGSSFQSPPEKSGGGPGQKREPLADITLPAASQALGALSSIAPVQAGLEQAGRSSEIPDSEYDEDELQSPDASPQKMDPTPSKLSSRAESGVDVATPTPASRRSGTPSTVRIYEDVEIERPRPSIPASRSTELPVLSSEKRKPLQTLAPVHNRDREDEDEDGDGEDQGLPGTPTPRARNVPIELAPSPTPELPSLAHHDAPHNKSSPLPRRHTQAKSQAAYSQGLESQRVPLDVIRSLGPQTDRTDLAVTLWPNVAEQIVEGTRVYHFRETELPAETSRIWLYVTSPSSELRYMATIGPGQKPGEIKDDGGVGNAEFNKGKSGKFAYELTQVYQLNNPISWKDIKKEGWFKAPPHPRQHTFLPPVIVGRLLMNLRWALFEEGEGEAVEDQGLVDPALGPSQRLRSEEVDTSQELENQFHSDNADPASRRSPASSPGLEKVLFQTPARARTRARTRGANTQPSQRLFRPSQATTASGPSSPVATGGAPGHDVVIISSPDLGGDAEDAEDEDSPLRRPATLDLLESLASSQAAAAAAALLQDSLFVQNVRSPPRLEVVLDSEGEGDG